MKLLSKVYPCTGGVSCGDDPRSFRQRQEHFARVHHTLSASAGMLTAGRVRVPAATASFACYAGVRFAHGNVQLQRIPADHELRGARILIAAHTNIAVDRIMTGLLDADCKGNRCRRTKLLALHMSNYTTSPL